VNQQYDQLQTLYDAGDLDWVGDSITALLGTGGTFISTDSVVSDSGFVTKRRVQLTGKVEEGGNLIANAVLFTNIEPGVSYQVLIVKNDGPSTPLLLGWFDEDFASNPLSVSNFGSFIVRPYLGGEAPTTPPDSGVWLTVQT
jgi:hypothetical protein